MDAFSLIKNIPYVFQSNNAPTNITADASVNSAMYRSLSQNEVKSELLGLENLDARDANTHYSASVHRDITDIDRDKSHPLQKEERFAFLDGFRAISMIWIIFGHTLTASTLNGIMNPAVLLPPTGMLTTMPAQIFLSSRFAVETFFFISGFLVTESLLKRLWSPPDTPHTGNGGTASSIAVEERGGERGGEEESAPAGDSDSASTSTYGDITYGAIETTNNTSNANNANNTLNPNQI